MSPDLASYFLLLYLKSLLLSNWFLPLFQVSMPWIENHLCFCMDFETLEETANRAESEETSAKSEETANRAQYVVNYLNKWLVKVSAVKNAITMIPTNTGWEACLACLWTPWKCIVHVVILCEWGNIKAIEKFVDLVNKKCSLLCCISSKVQYALDTIPLKIWHV